MGENRQASISPDPLARDGEGKSDTELVELALKNQKYFLYLMKRYEAQLMRYIRRISNSSHEDAEDILQEVFVKVFENLNDFDTKLKFSSWVYRITHNHVISSYRKAKARPQYNSIELSDEIANKLAANLDIEQEVDAKFIRDNIDKVLEKLDLKYREALVLRYLDEKDYNEISDILKKPIGTIASLVNRGKQKFRETLDEQNINI